MIKIDNQIQVSNYQKMKIKYTCMYHENFFSMKEIEVFKALSEEFAQENDTIAINISLTTTAYTNIISKRSR